MSSYVFHHALAWLGDIDTSPQIGNFRIFSRQVAHAFQLYREQFRLLPALMARLGFSVDYVEVSRGARRSGRSSYSFRKLFRLATDAVIANSEKPLWLGIYLGLSIATIAFALSIWALYRRIVYGGSIDGWASLFFAVSFFSGVQLTFSGILGVYLGRVYNETKNRPLYLVADTSSLSQARMDADGDRSAEPERMPRRRRSGKAEGRSGYKG